MKKYLVTVAFIVLTGALFGFVLPALVSHKSNELPLFGGALFLAYLPAAVWFYNKLVEKTK